MVLHIQITLMKCTLGTNGYPDSCLFETISWMYWPDSKDLQINIDLTLMIWHTHVSLIYNAIQSIYIYYPGAYFIMLFTLTWKIGHITMLGANYSANH